MPNVITKTNSTKIKQPKGLYLLSATELWERFGFYVLQVILVLYMSKGLSFSDHKAYILFAVFSALVYLMPVIGGYLADHYIGYQKAIIIGGVLFIISYLLMAFPDPQIFFVGLSLLIVAHGLFKSNISSFVGTLYEDNDPRREGGFTLFYMVINLGALIPPLIAGFLIKNYGWHISFLLAAGGLLLGMVIFLLGKKSLGDRGGIPSHSPLLRGIASKLKFNVGFYLAICIVTAVGYVAFQFPRIANEILEYSGIFIFLIIFYFMFKESGDARKRMFAAIILIVISIGFWAIYNQTFTSLMLYADRNMTQHILGFPLDAEATQFFNPFFIIIVSPILSQVWTRLARRKKNPSIPTKFTIGLLLLAIAFLLLSVGARYFGQDGVNSPWWLVISYLLQSMGELFLAPIGMSMIAELSPKHLVGMMMGVWFYALSIAGAFSGTLATFTDVSKEVTATASLAIYGHGFLIFGIIALILSVISLALVPFLKRMIVITEVE